MQIQGVYQAKTNDRAVKGLARLTGAATLVGASIYLGKFYLVRELFVFVLIVAVLVFFLCNLVLIGFLFAEAFSAIGRRLRQDRAASLPQKHVYALPDVPR